ncbi:MAG TPA: carboxymuconolactone decarboxylase family protein [Roseiarcus sp.]|nr:carboxymuconolactone decarboxylase family protein [Roseiarcus sp.]
MKVRREVVGDAYVDRSVGNVSDFMRPMQELVTEYCWGDVWMRPGLPRRDRSIINLSLLTALNRPNELRLHVRGAVNNGLMKAEISEIAMTAADTPIQIERGTLLISFCPDAAQVRAS